MDPRTCLLLVVFAVFLPACFASCRNGWATFEENCYLFSHGRSTWGEAYATCLALHSDLAVITSDDEQNFLISELYHIHRHDASHLRYWIDGTDLEVENVWKWAKTGQTLSYVNWASGEPNNAEGGNCMNLYGTGGFKMADDDCDIKLFYICQSTSVESGSTIIG